MQKDINMRAQITELADEWDKIAAVYAEAAGADRFKQGVVSGMGNCVYELRAMLEQGAKPVPATTVAAYIEAWNAWQEHLHANGLPGMSP